MPRSLALSVQGVRESERAKERERENSTARQQECVRERVSEEATDSTDPRCATNERRQESERERERRTGLDCCCRSLRTLTRTHTRSLSPVASSPLRLPPSSRAFCLRSVCARLFLFSLSLSCVPRLASSLSLLTARERERQRLESVDRKRNTARGIESKKRRGIARTASVRARVGERGSSSQQIARSLSLASSVAHTHATQRRQREEEEREDLSSESSRDRRHTDTHAGRWGWQERQREREGESEGAKKQTFDHTQGRVAWDEHRGRDREKKREPYSKTATAI